jgi:hypothetical protein
MNISIDARKLSLAELRAAWLEPVTVELGD